MMEYTTLLRKRNQVGLPSTEVTLWNLHSFSSVKDFFPLIFTNDPPGFIWQMNTIALAKHLVNFKNLNRILKSKIFLHTDGQLRVAYVILGYKPSTKRL